VFTPRRTITQAINDIKFQHEQEVLKHKEIINQEEHKKFKEEVKEKGTIAMSKFKLASGILGAHKSLQQMLHDKKINASKSTNLMGADHFLSIVGLTGSHSHTSHSSHHASKDGGNVTTQDTLKSGEEPIEIDTAVEPDDAPTDTTNELISTNMNNTNTNTQTANNINSKITTSTHSNNNGIDPDGLGDNPALERRRTRLKLQLPVNLPHHSSSNALNTSQHKNNNSSLSSHVATPVSIPFRHPFATETRQSSAATSARKMQTKPLKKTPLDATKMQIKRVPISMNHLFEEESGAFGKKRGTSIAGSPLITTRQQSPPLNQPHDDKKNPYFLFALPDDEHIEITTSS